MLKDTILKLKQLMLEFDRPIPSRASVSEIEKFKEWAVEQFGEKVPWEKYIPFLEEVNSIEFNGIYLYGIDPDDNYLDIIENNEIWHDVEENKKYLFLGDGNISWYVWDSEIDEFQELDKPSGEVMETFESCNAMLIEALQTAIN
ncbi:MULTISPECIES: YrhA family protein [Listeria]|uniref:SMI1/KNR4 family protein n=1 Tax=Listeria immobilis TaxID=2713502 RepID=A0A7X0X9I0_9LIST|nr:MULTISPECIES: YrhA family protein [Listeria]MBC1481542.1 SMI1/KNR4 family protein [Listeria seeligeri]MBC1490095.1 SMI1/KNR4 family protein [Listeria immobilis]